MPLTLTKAVRTQLKLRIGLFGPSGSGKTYTALLLAKGLGGSTLLLDTESGRGLVYATEFDYYYKAFEKDEQLSPENFIKYIKEAESAGVDNLIIDSSSHEWFFLCDVHDKMTGNGWANWAKITPRHTAFIEAIIRSKMHIITTIRGKDKYEQEEKDGQKKIKKLGVGAQQRDGFEYEFNVTFSIEQDTHNASPMKDDTHHFDGNIRRLTAEDGAFLKRWADSGETKKEPEPVKTQQGTQPEPKKVFDPGTETIDYGAFAGTVYAKLDQAYLAIEARADNKNLDHGYKARKTLDYLRLQGMLEKDEDAEAVKGIQDALDLVKNLTDLEGWKTKYGAAIKGLTQQQRDSFNKQYADAKKEFGK